VLTSSYHVVESRSLDLYHGISNVLDDTAPIDPDSLQAMLLGLSQNGTQLLKLVRAHRREFIRLGLQLALVQSAELRLHPMMADKKYWNGQLLMLLPIRQPHVSSLAVGRSCVQAGKLCIGSSPGSSVSDST
jgi:hypothetical protein